MTTLVGGLRSRMVFDSCYKVINDSLTALGWFGPSRRHAPINFTAGEQNTLVEVPLNTLALSDENVSSTPWELGSELAEHTRWYYVDFFAEDDAVGKHLIGDVRDILEGRLPSIGRRGATMPVYDMRQATPPVLFSCEVANCRIDRAHDYSHEWLRHWYSVQFVLLDYYGDETDL